MGIIAFKCDASSIMGISMTKFHVEFLIRPYDENQTLFPYFEFVQTKSLAECEVAVESYGRFTFIIDFEGNAYNTVELCCIDTTDGTEYSATVMLGELFSMMAQFGAIDAYKLPDSNNCNVRVEWGAETPSESLDVLIFDSTMPEIADESWVTEHTIETVTLTSADVDPDDATVWFKTGVELDKRPFDCFAPDSAIGGHYVTIDTLAEPPVYLCVISDSGGPK